MPPSTGILDNFNRADGGVGSNYVVIFGGMNVVSNQAAGASGAGIVLWNASTFVANSEVYVAVPAIGTNNGDLLGLYIRASGTAISNFNAYNAVIQINTSGNDQYRISRIVNGTENVLVSTTAFGDAQAGDRLWFIGSGSTLTLYRERGGTWTEILSTSDNNITGGGKVGFGIVSSAARVDDFGGGSVPIKLTGTGQFTFPTTAGLTVRKSLVGNSVVVFGQAGAVQVVKRLVGQAGVLFGQSGAIHVQKRVVGSGGLVFLTNASLRAVKRLGGTAQMLFTVFGRWGTDTTVEVDATVTQRGVVSTTIARRGVVTGAIIRRGEIDVS